MNLINRIVANVQLLIDDFCSYTVINGAKFLHSSRPAGVKWFWRWILFTLAIISVVFIDYFYDQYLKAAIITVIDLTPQGYAFIFPSVYICPRDIFKDDNISRYAEMLITHYNLKTNKEDLKKCIRIYSLEYPLEDDFEDICMEFVNATSTGKLGPNIAPAFKNANRFLRNCSFKGQSIDCQSRFINVETIIGPCAVFNNGHFETFLKRKVEKIAEYEPNWDLKFELRIPEKQTIIFVLDSHRVVNIRDTPDFIMTPNTLRTQINFEIIQKSVSDVIREISKDQRKCNFNDELEPYNEYIKPIYRKEIYLEDLCLIHCFARIIIERCKCLPTRIAQYFDDYSYPKCLEKALTCAKILTLSQHMAVCKDCRPNCEYLRFRIHNVIEPDFKNTIFLGNTFNFTFARNTTTETGFREMTVGLSDWPPFHYRITIVYGVMDLLVSFAGVASFFFGFSFVAIFELIYYSCIRFYCAFFTHKQEIDEQVKKNQEIPRAINLSLVPRRPIH